jgi:NTE family protein
MNKQTPYHGQLLKPRQFKEIVEGRFDISEIVRIERKNNQDTISDKTFDFSAGTIRQLLDEGFNEATEFINDYIQTEKSKQYELKYE